MAKAGKIIKRKNTNWESIATKLNHLVNQHERTIETLHEENVEDREEIRLKAKYIEELHVSLTIKNEEIVHLRQKIGALPTPEKIKYLEGTNKSLFVEVDKLAKLNKELTEKLERQYEHNRKLSRMVDSAKEQIKMMQGYRTTDDFKKYGMVGDHEIKIPEPGFKRPMPLYDFGRSVIDDKPGEHLFDAIRYATAHYNKLVNDPVNRPAHYTDGKIEVIDFINDKKLNFELGNAVKYVCRAGKKDPAKYIEDLEKAIWYIKHEIKTKAKG